MVCVSIPSNRGKLPDPMCRKFLHAAISLNPLKSGQTSGLIKTKEAPSRQGVQSQSPQIGANFRTQYDFPWDP